MTGVLPPNEKSHKGTETVGRNCVIDLVHKPESSLLESDDHVPVMIEGLTLIEDKYLCVCVVISKRMPDGLRVFVRKELLKTEYFRQKWPQMLIRFYEEKTSINSRKLMY